MQKNKWNRKIDWNRSGTTSPFIYHQEHRDEIYDKNKHISVSDIYFKLNKFLTGVTFTYITSLDDVYNMENLLTGDGHSLFNMYNEYDVIDRVMKNFVIVDIAADSNINIDYQWYEINDVKIKPGHLVLLKNQKIQSENDIYFVDNQYFLYNARLLDSREKSDKFSCGVKLGKNADKQFFLVNNGYEFPIFGEPKNFIEGKSHILKNLIQYNIFNQSTITEDVSKIVFTDYDLARKQISENYIRYDQIYITGVTISSTPSNYFTIRYHHDEYTIRSGTTLAGTLTGITSDIINYGGYTSIPISDGSDFIDNDYIYLNIFSGVSFLDSSTHLEMNQFIKEIISLSGVNYIVLEETIPNYILEDLKNCTFFIENLKVAIDWDDAIEKMSDYTPYSDFYSLTGYTLSTSIFKDIYIEPKENVYDKYFDYDGLLFDVDDIHNIYTFSTLIPYLKYKLYDFLNNINTGFSEVYSFFNEQVISGETLNLYRYVDDSRIRITTTLTGLTNIFKPYTYVNLSAIGEITRKALVYSVIGQEIIVEKPTNWTLYPNQAQLPRISAIQNIDGLKNISDILYEVYINKSYDWYIRKSSNERKYIARTYAELLNENKFFRDNVTGMLYENDNNEFILKLYDLLSDTNLKTFETIELIYIGSDRKSRLPIPIKLIDTSGITGTTYYIDWDVLDDGIDDSLDGDGPTGIIGDYFDGGLDSVLPGINKPPLIYTQVDGGLDTNLALDITTTTTTIVPIITTTTTIASTTTTTTTIVPIITTTTTTTEFLSGFYIFNIQPLETDFIIMNLIDNVEYDFQTPITYSFNFLYITIPENKTAIIYDSMNYNITNTFELFNDYTFFGNNNNLYKSTNMFYSGFMINYKIKIF